MAFCKKKKNEKKKKEKNSMKAKTSGPIFKVLNIIISYIKISKKENLPCFSIFSNDTF